MSFLTYGRQGKIASLIFLLLVVIAYSDGWSQTETAPVKGIRERTPNVHALVNARIVQQPGSVIEKGTIVIRDGVIEAVGENVTAPPDARVWDYDGITVYAGFIEMNSQVGLPKPKRTAQRQTTAGSFGRAPQPQQSDDRRGPQGWNPNAKPDLQAVDLYKPDKKDLAALRKLGFTTAVIAPNEGVFKGNSALVTLGDGPVHDHILSKTAYQQIAMDRVRGR
ncbi:MAG: hypothetical protein V3U73_02060, partial [bacterium]